jgi:hypothetical protein
MNTEDLEDILVIGDEDFEHTEQAEYDDYLLVRDPTSSDPNSWCVVLLGGTFNDWVVQFSEVAVNTETDQLTYQYSILSPEEDTEYDQVEFTNLCTSTLSKILVSLHEAGAQSYVDLRTGEEVDTTS